MSMQSGEMKSSGCTVQLHSHAEILEKCLMCARNIIGDVPHDTSKESAEPVSVVDNLELQISHVSSQAVLLLDQLARIEERL